MLRPTDRYSKRNGVGYGMGRDDIIRNGKEHEGRDKTGWYGMRRYKTERGDIHRQLTFKT